jgi:hypothetical protein
MGGLMRMAAFGSPFFIAAATHSCDLRGGIRWHWDDTYFAAPMVTAAFGTKSSTIL